MDLKTITIEQNINKREADKHVTRKGAVDNILPHWLLPREKENKQALLHDVADAWLSNKTMTKAVHRDRLE